ncbi:MAG: ABC transporter C-terminal domain-containing protein [Dehalococcoidia bacterium]
MTDELIESLESDLKFIEHEIELASKSSNVDKITELGKRYKEVSGKLDEAVKNWGIN